MKHIGKAALDMDDHVAPPRGERGLKLDKGFEGVTVQTVAPPRGERGLKLVAGYGIICAIRVAPPRGERGLKPLDTVVMSRLYWSLPLVGSVD